MDRVGHSIDGGDHEFDIRRSKSTCEYTADTNELLGIRGNVHSHRWTTVEPL